MKAILLSFLLLPPICFAETLAFVGSPISVEKTSIDCESIAPKKPKASDLEEVCMDNSALCIGSGNMRWQIEIESFEGDARLMIDLLKELSLNVDEVGGKYLLSGPALESLVSSSSVHDYGKNLNEIAAEVSKYDQGMELGLSFSVVIENSSSGVRRHHFVDIKETVSISVTTFAAIIIHEPSNPLTEEEIQNREAERREREYQELRQHAVSRFVSAVKNDRARMVQRLLSKKANPQILGHIADIIQEDLGGGISSLATKNQLSRFYRSINHPDVYGEDARHIVSRVDPPPDPMTLPESTAFIREIARAWLNLKAGAPNA